MKKLNPYLFVSHQVYSLLLLSLLIFYYQVYSLHSLLGVYMYVTTEHCELQKFSQYCVQYFLRSGHLFKLTYNLSLFYIGSAQKSTMNTIFFIYYFEKKKNIYLYRKLNPCHFGWVHIHSFKADFLYNVNNNYVHYLRTQEQTQLILTNKTNFFQ